MKYIRGKKYRPRHKAGVVTWYIINRWLECKGAAEYETLVALAKGHDREGGGKGYVDYLIKHEWLQQQ